MIFSGGDRQIRTYEQGIFCQALEIQGMPVLIEIFSKGTVEEPELDLSVHTDNSLSKGKIVFVRSLISSMFNLNEDLTPFYQAMETDAIMMDLICKLRGIGRWTAELTILRGLHRPDAFPADDIGVRRFIAQFYLNNKKKYLQMRPVLLQSDGETGKDLLRTILKSQICWESPPLHRRKSLT
jgi:hypothetical protein